MRPDTDQLDLRLVVPAALAWLGTAVAVWVSWWGPVAVLAIGAVVVRLGWARRWVATGLIGAMVVILAPLAITVAATLRVVAIQDDTLIDAAAAGSFISATATVADDPRIVQPAGVWADRGSAGLVLLGLTVTEFDLRGVRYQSSRAVGARADAGSSAGRALVAVIPGTVVRVGGLLSAARLPNGRIASLDVREVEVIATAPGWQQVAAELRNNLRESAKRRLSADAAGLLPGLAVGDESLQSQELHEVMRVSGLTHLTAVSGGNVAIVVGVTVAMAAAIGLRRRGRAVVGLLALVGFVVLVRGSPSVLRAALMGAVSLLAISGLGRRRGPPALAAAVLVLLLVDPFLAVSYGFGLSVLATAGIIAIAPRLRVALARLLPARTPALLIDALTLTLAAQVATLPLLVSLGSGIGLAAIPANLLAAPAVPLATIAGLAAVMVLPWTPAAGDVAVAIGGTPAAWIGWVARRCAELPVTAIAWPAGALGAGLMVGALAALVALIVVRRRAPAFVKRITQVCPPTTAAALAMVLIAAAVVPGRVHPKWPLPGWAVVSCDVGQGDATVVSTGVPGHAVLIDTGPDPVPIDRCLSDLGVRVLPLLVLTHFHADHVSGLSGAIRGRSIGMIMTSPLAEPENGTKRVLEIAQQRQVPVRTTGPGEQGVVEGLSYRVLWPARIIRDEQSAPNNASVVIEFEVGGVRLLLTGDIEPAAQAAILARGLGRYDVVKVPHHGSRHQNPRFASTVVPQVALISCGAGNDYGHPAPVTVRAYSTLGTRVLRTDQSGDLAVGRQADQTLVTATRR